FGGHADHPVVRRDEQDAPVPAKGAVRDETSGLDPPEPSTIWRKDVEAAGTSGEDVAVCVDAKAVGHARRPLCHFIRAIGKDAAIAYAAVLAQRVGDPDRMRLVRIGDVERRARIPRRLKEYRQTILLRPS